MIHLTRLSFFVAPSLEKTSLFPTISFGEVNLYLGDITLYLGELGLPLGKIGLTGETCPFPPFSLEEMNLSLVNIILYLGELGLAFGKIGLAGETCPSLAFFLGEVKLSTIFSLREKILPFGGVILSSCRNLFFLRGTTISPYPPLGHLPSALSLGKITFLAAFSFRGVNLPLGKKALFLEEHSLNLLVSFSLGAMNLPHGEVVLYAPFSLRGTNSSSREFVLPFGENFLSLENWLY